MRFTARALRDADASSMVSVELDGASACQRCAGGQGCGAGLLNPVRQSVQLECQTDMPVKANQQVYLENSEETSSWLWLVAGAYGLPLLGLLVVSLVAHGLLAEMDLTNLAVTTDTLVAMAGAAGLTGGVIAWRKSAPFVTVRVQDKLCIQSMRIVAVENTPLTTFLTTTREKSDES